MFNYLISMTSYLKRQSPYRINVAKFFALGLLISAVYIFNSCTTDIATPTPPVHKAISVHVELGVPKDTDSSDDFYIVRPQYFISYNQNRNTPNWVSWNLDSAWYGDAKRYSGSFLVDTALPPTMYWVTHSDYTNSGYDRGHMVRSEERTKNDADNYSTFFLTNILPQTPDLNQHVWLSLEMECERMCKTDNKELYVIAGGKFSASPNKLKGKVSVPDSCWKIVVVLQRGEKMENVTATTPVYAVMMNNGIYAKDKYDWKLYKTTARAIEQSTGYNFLSDVPQSIQDVIETKVW